MMEYVHFRTKMEVSYLGFASESLFLNARPNGRLPASGTYCFLCPAPLFRLWRKTRQ